MSTQWRCAVCEAVNEGGDTCAACGARVTQTVIQAPPAPTRTATPKRTQAPEERVEDGTATDIPVRELPRRRLEPDRPDDGPYDIYDLLDLTPAADTETIYDGYERIDTRPRVQVYGCCLPIALGMLLAFLATVLLLANLLLGAL
jgi:hypothetical protein